jgi:hypothetical protein
METTRAVRQPGPALSHRERDACLHALGALHAEGALSFAELDARITAALRATTHEELTALVREDTAVVPRSRRPGGRLFAVRVIIFLALAVIGALVRMLALAAVAICVGVVRTIVATRAVPARLAKGGPATKELVLVPRPQVPAQRDPAKVHPVLVPTETGSPSTELVLVRRSAEVVPVRPAAVRGAILAAERASDGVALPHEERRVQGLVSQLRPLVHRVSDRARWRRLTADACQRAARWSLPTGPLWTGHPGVAPGRPARSRGGPRRER